MKKYLLLMIGFCLSIISLELGAQNSVEVFVWEDLNGNGIQDGAEVGIDGISMADLVLYHDLNGNGLPDGAPMDVIINHDGGVGGTYTFTDATMMPDGDYIVGYTETLGSYYVTMMNAGGTPATDSDLDPTTAFSAPFAVAGGVTEMDIDLGLYLVGSIGDFVWEDLNGNGNQDGGEPGIAGLSVTLLDAITLTPITMDANGPIPANPVFTDGGGMYNFPDLIPGDYIVEFSAPAPIGGVDWYTTVTIDVDPADGTMDSDADPNDDLRSHTIALESDELEDKIDAGFWLPAKIGNQVFCDENGDGIDNDGVDGVDDIDVNLIDANTGVIALDANGNDQPLTKTASGGMYEFDLVPPGEYIVEFSFPGAPGPADPPFVFTLQDQGGDEMVDSDVDPAAGGTQGQTPIIEVTSQDIDEETMWDAGVYQLITITGTIFFDDDMSNTQNGAEDGPGGILVNLYEDGNKIDDVLTTQGVYEFPSNPGIQLPPGNYQVEIDVTAFAAGGPLAGATPCAGQNPADDMVDNDDNGSDDIPATSTEFNLLSNCDPNTPPVVEYVDFCYFFNCNMPNDLAAFTCEDIAEVDIICDITTLGSFCAIMPSNDSPQPQPMPLCQNSNNNGGGAHNISWFAFVAYGGNYTVTVTPTGCAGSTTGDEGVQIGLYTDCTFSESVYCNPACSTDPVAFQSSDLEEGQTYYFFIDGCSSSVCSYEVDITGTPLPPNLAPTDLCIDNSGSIECADGNTYCPNAEVLFAVQGIDLTVDYSWDIITVSGAPYTGDVAPMTTEGELPVTFPDEGEYTVCISNISNGCQNWGGTFCRTVIIAGLDDEEFDMQEVCDIDEFNATFNPMTTLENGSATNPFDPNGDATEGWQDNSTTFVIGNNMTTITTPEGCEYIQEVELSLFPVSDVGLVDMTFCREDLPVTIDGTQYTETTFGGNITFSLPGLLLVNETDVNGCDSIVDIELEILDIFNGTLDQGICTPDGVIMEFDYGASLSTDESFITWVWTDESGNVVDDNTFNPTDPLDNIAPLGTGSETYTLTATIIKDGVTCTFPYSLTINFDDLLPPAPSITGSPLMICESDSIQTYTASDFGDAFNYIWDVPSDVNILSGGGVNDQTIEINWAGSTGGTIALTGVNGCGNSDESSINITLVPILTPDFSVTAEVCQDSSSIITFSGPTDDIDSYMWDFDGGTINNATGGNGPGPHEVSWADGGVDHTITLTVTHNGGCTSTETFDVVSTIAPLVPPVVNCNPNTGEVSFTWADVAGATGYEVVVTSTDMNGDLHVGVLSGNTFTVTALQDGETVTIELIVMTGDACQMVVGTAPGCTSQDCVAPTIELDAGAGPGTLISICTADITGTIDLSATIVSGENGTGEFSGDGIIDAAAGTFDPSQANIGINTINYLFMTDDPVPCIGTQSINIEILETPLASFTTSDDTVCITDPVLLTYDGTAGINTSNYTVTDGQTFNQSDPSITFTTLGTQTITLSVIKDGCESSTFTRTVFVQPELEPLVINCSVQEIDMVEFTWNDVVGATGYEVTVTNADGSVDPAFTTGATTYMQNNLNPGDIISISVTVLTDSRCPGDMNISQMCEAKACPTFTFDYDSPVTDICVNNATNPITLQAMATGGDDSGAYTWAGSPNITGDQFDPTGLPEGQYQLFVTYNENGCEGDGSVIVNITLDPTASFVIAPDPICIGSTLTIDYTGSNLTGQVINWAVSDPAVSVTATADPAVYTATFDNVGTWDIMLDVVNGACTTAPANASITVEPELVFGDIDCDEDLDQITFTWGDVDCASEYEVFVDGVSQGTQTTTTYIATGLTDGQEVELEVIAVSGCACGNVMNTMMCEARPCVQVTLDVSAMGGTTDFCFADDLVTIDVLAALTDETSEGSGTYSGTAVDPVTGTFDPVAAGIGSHTVTYTWIEPDGCQDFTGDVTFNIFENPEVTAMADPIDCYSDSMTMLNIVPTNGDGNYTITSDGADIPLMSEVMEGTYDILVSDGNNCIAETSVTVAVPAEPMPSITGADLLISGETSNYSIEQSIFTGLAIDSIVWTANGAIVCNEPGCFSLSNQAPVENTTYEVTVFYNNGCSVVRSIEVEVNEPDPIYTVDIPNIISPNGDGQNDDWMIFTGDPEVIVSSVRIMDRWGNVVFTELAPYSPATTPITWNGKFGTADLQPGVYVYSVEYTQDGRDRIRNGDITIIR